MILSAWIPTVQCCNECHPAPSHRLKCPTRNVEMRRLSHQHPQLLRCLLRCLLCRYLHMYRYLHVDIYKKCRNSHPHNKTLECFECRAVDCSRVHFRFQPSRCQDNIKAEHRPGFHKRWSADPQPVPIGGTYFTICSLQPEVPSCRSCSSAALISCSPSRTSALATYFNVWITLDNYTHQKMSKEGLKSS